MVAQLTDIEVIRNRCASDPKWFAYRYAKTQDPQADDPIRKWPEYPFLYDCLDAFTAAVILVVYKKSRQMMLSWAVCLFAIWYVAFQHNRQVMVQSEKEDKAKALVRRMEFILKHLPEWLLPCTYSVTAQTITFHHKDGDSWIMAVPSGPDQIRSYSPSVVIFDESAWQKYIRDAHEAAVPAVKGGGKIIHISTPGPANEENAQFFKHLVENQAYQHVTLHYSQLPPEARPDNSVLGLSQPVWDREFEGSFTVGAGQPVFKPPFVKHEYVIPVGLNLPLAHTLEGVLTIGLDYGVRHPAAVFGQVIPQTKQVYIFRSFTGRNITLPLFAEEVWRVTKSICKDHFESLKKRGKIRWFDDPAGCARKDVGSTSREAMNAHGIYPANSAKKVPVLESVMLIRERLMPRRDPDGRMRPGMLVDPSCSLLIDALDGAYVTDSDTEESDSKREKKFKGGMTEHEVDALRYFLAGVFRLGQS